MSDFAIMLLFFGPMIAVDVTRSGALFPGAIAVAIFSLTRHASFWRNITVGGFCLSVTAILMASKRDPVEVALIFVATAIPFAMQALIAIGLVQSLHRFNARLDQFANENKPPNS